MSYVYILLGFLLVMGVLAFAVYGTDKSKAERGVWRIPEATLLGLSAFGGCFGGIAAMMIFHHKTKHWYFWVLNVAACIVYAVFFVILLSIDY